VVKNGFVAAVLLLIYFAQPNNAQSWTYPPDGWATMTHYDLPTNYIASCGCTAKSTHYPTVALSQLAFRGTAAQNGTGLPAFGPSCGKCMNLTLVNSIYSNPPFYPNPTKSVVVKVTDQCPGPGLCGATPGNPNSVGAYLNFDLAYPSVALKEGWYPSNISEYGYTDFGVWNVTYETVSCEHWAGWKDKAALGSIPNDVGYVCCPADVNSTFVCPTWDSGIPAPDTTTSGTSRRATLDFAVVLSGLLASSLASLSVIFC